jgi:hypothetical protein
MKLYGKGVSCVKCNSCVEFSEAKVIKRIQTNRDAIYIIKELKLPELRLNIFELFEK